jgi:hypothetical protein
MNGSQFFGRSGGSLASTATSGQSGSTGGPACGSADNGASTAICSGAGQMNITVNSQPYSPSLADMITPPTCIVTPV